MKQFIKCSAMVAGVAIIIALVIIFPTQRTDAAGKEPLVPNLANGDVEHPEALEITLKDVKLFKVKAGIDYSGNVYYTYFEVVTLPDGSKCYQVYGKGIDSSTYQCSPSIQQQEVK